MESLNQESAARQQQQRARTITPPSRQDGIGNALRAVYDANMQVLPDDMQNLLARLG